MLDGIASSLCSSPFSNDGDRSRAPRASFMKTSVLPDQTITSRSQPCFSLKARMSAISCSARSRLFLPFLTFGPSSRLT